MEDRGKIPPHENDPMSGHPTSRATAEVADELKGKSADSINGPSARRGRCPVGRKRLEIAFHLCLAHPNTVLDCEEEGPPCNHRTPRSWDLLPNWMSASSRIPNCTFTDWRFQIVQHVSASNCFLFCRY